MAHDVKRAVQARDAASARVRTVTALATAACIGSTLLFAGLAAGSTHFRKVVLHRQRPQVRRTTPRGPVEAPAPPLVAVAAPPTEAAAPPPAPTPAYSSQPPVVVSGGS